MQALAQNDVLQIVIFALAFGIAVGRIGDKGKPIVAFMESVTEAMFVLTNGIMHYAPIGVGAAIAYTVGTRRARRAVAPGGARRHALRRARRLPRRRAAAGGADRARAACAASSRAVARAGADRVLHGVVGGGAAARDGDDRGDGRAAADRRLHPAARLQLQPRRLDALSVAGVDLRGAGGGRAPDASGSRRRCC